MSLGHPGTKILGAEVMVQVIVFLSPTWGAYILFLAPDFGLIQSWLALVGLWEVNQWIELLSLPLLKIVPQESRGTSSQKQPYYSWHPHSIFKPPPLLLLPHTSETPTAVRFALEAALCPLDDTYQVKSTLQRSLLSHQVLPDGVWAFSLDHPPWNTPRASR